MQIPGGINTEEPALATLDAEPSSRLSMDHSMMFISDGTGRNARRVMRYSNRLLRCLLTLVSLRYLHL